MMTPSALIFVVVAVLASVASAFVVSTSPLARNPRNISGTPHLHEQCPGSRSTGARPNTQMMADSAEDVKSKVLQLAGVMDRGSSANPGVSNTCLDTKNDMRLLVESLTELSPVNKPLTLAQLSGRWELVFSTVEPFQASPFFQMMEAGYGNRTRSNVFFKLHELETGSWNGSSIARVTQVWQTVSEETDAPSWATEGSQNQGNSTATVAASDTSGGSDGCGFLESEVDLAFLPPTSIPLVWLSKLLPTFGGSVAIKAKCLLTGDNNQIVQLVVETMELKAVKDVPLPPLVGLLFERGKFPIGAAAEKMMGSVPVTKQTVVFIDDTLRVMEDRGGELFIFARSLKID